MDVSRVRPIREYVRLVRVIIQYTVSKSCVLWCSHGPRAVAGAGVRVAARRRELVAAAAVGSRARAAAADLLHSRSGVPGAFLVHVLRYDREIALTHSISILIFYSYVQYCTSSAAYLYSYSVARAFRVEPKLTRLIGVFYSWMLDVGYNIVVSVPMYLHAVHVISFNRQRPLPDVDQESPIINQLLQSGPFGSHAAAAATLECAALRLAWHTVHASLRPLSHCWHLSL